MNVYRIQTTDIKRRGQWYRHFGLESLPVKHARPRYHELPGRTVLAFDLDGSRLSSGAVDSFAHVIASNEQIPFVLARTQVDGYALPVANCTVVSESMAVSSRWEGRPFLFLDGIQQLSVSYS